jgi:uncharacterized membrane protein YbhN (UPF0104 family)
MGPVAVTVAVLALLIAYLYLQRSYVEANYAFAFGKLFAIAGLVAATLALRGMSNQLLFARLGVSAPLGDWFAIASVSALSSYLPAAAGLVSKAHFLKRVHSVPYRKFAVGQVALLLLGVAAHGAVGLATIAVWRPAAAAWLALGFAAMSAVGLLVLLPDRAAQFARRRWFPIDTETLARLRDSAPGVIALQVGVLLATAGALELGFSMGPADVSFAACIVFSAGTVLTRLVWFTPGGLGAREFLVGGLAVLTGYGLRDAMIAACVLRLAEVGASIALGGVASIRLTQRLAAIPELAPESQSSGARPPGTV